MCIRDSVGGQYDPFAFETLLNASFLPFEVPRALAHEWSHAAGFGDEGDANLIGTLTCLRSADPLIRYSGAYWTYGELPESDRRRIHLAPAVVADFNAGRDRYLRYYNPGLFAISWSFYDRYLRANGEMCIRDSPRAAPQPASPARARCGARRSPQRPPSCSRSSA